MPSDAPARIDSSRTTITLPEGVYPQRFTGTDDYLVEAYLNDVATADVQITVSDDERTITYETLRGLMPGQNLDVRVQFPHGLLPVATPEWQAAEQRDDVVGLGVLALSLLLLVGGPLGVLLLWYLRGRDPQLGIVVPDYVSDPPDALPPAIVGALIDEKVDMQDIISTLIDLAHRGYLTMEGAFTIGTIVAFGAYLGQLYGPLMALTNAPVEFAQSMVSFERVFEVLDIPLEIAEVPHATPLQQVEGRITFDHVTFDYTALGSGQRPGLSEVVRYDWGGSETLVRRGRAGKPRAVAYRPNGAAEKDAAENSNGATTEVVTSEAAMPEAAAPRRAALKDVDFHIEPGQLAALVGPSGAGKTTITYLIPRLYDPTGGRVLIDGRDLRQVTLQSLAENIGMVTQETYLFYDTIRANLLYARPDATEAEMIAAALADGARPYIWGWFPGMKARGKAPGYFELVIANAPYSEYAPLALMNIARCHMRAHNTDAAMYALDRMINSYPDNLLAPDAYLQLAKAHVATDKAIHRAR